MWTVETGEFPSNCIARLENRKREIQKATPQFISIIVSKTTSYEKHNKWIKSRTFEVPFNKHDRSLSYFQFVLSDHLTILNFFCIHHIIRKLKIKMNIFGKWHWKILHEFFSKFGLDQSKSNVYRWEGVCVFSATPRQLKLDQRLFSDFFFLLPFRPINVRDSHQPNINFVTQRSCSGIISFYLFLMCHDLNDWELIQRRNCPTNL